MDKAILKLENVTKTYDGAKALSGVSWEAESGKFITVLGPSGCGKSTMLSVVAGLEAPDEGRILFEGEDITCRPAYRRPFNTVFQNYALFPHMNVYENVAFALRLKKVNKEEIKVRVQKLLGMVNLSGYEKRDVSSLSGGEQQRVAIARALANEPKILLLDEPLSALDLKLRREMQRELKNLQRETGITFIYVTHDQEEALSLSDKIIVMDKGVICQQGTPDEIYRKPHSTYVAKFIGEGNILKVVVTGDGTARISDTENIRCCTDGFSSGDEAFVMIRPECVSVKIDGQSPSFSKACSCTFKGEYYEVSAVSNGIDIRGRSSIPIIPGENVKIAFKDEVFHLMRS